MSHIFNNPQYNNQTVFFLVAGSTPDLFQIHKKNNWSTEVTAKDFISQFSESSSIDDAILDIERDTRRGKGSVVYYHHTSFDVAQERDDASTRFSENIPHGYALVAYEGDHTYDCGFIVSDTLGVIKNDNYLGYARLVKL